MVLAEGPSQNHPRANHRVEIIQAGVIGRPSAKQNDP
jgi:hypothetical protein